MVTSDFSALRQSFSAMTPFFSVKTNLVTCLASVALSALIAFVDVELNFLKLSFSHGL